MIQSVTKTCQAHASPDGSLIVTRKLHIEHR